MGLVWPLYIPEQIEEFIQDLETQGKRHEATLFEVNTRTRRNMERPMNNSDLARISHGPLLALVEAFKKRYGWIE